MANPETVNIKGADGVTPTITLGTVEFVENVEDGSIENSGSDTDLVLDFKIPLGTSETVSGKEVKLIEIIPAEDGFVKSYKLVYSDDNTDVANSEQINIPEGGTTIDSFLKDVSFDSTTNILKFTFETTNGESTEDIDLTGLIDTYSAGTGLSLDSTTNTFSAKIADDLTTSDSETSLSANQGVILSGLISQNADDIEDLDTRITDIENELDVNTIELDSEILTKEDDTDDSIKSELQKYISECVLNDETVLYISNKELKCELLSNDTVLDDNGDGDSIITILLKNIDFDNNIITNTLFTYNITCAAGVISTYNRDVKTSKLVNVEKLSELENDVPFVSYEDLEIDPINPNFDFASKAYLDQEIEYTKVSGISKPVDNYNYNINDFIHTDGKIYKCIEAHEYSIFDATKWEVFESGSGGSSQTPQFSIDFTTGELMVDYI